MVPYDLGRPAPEAGRRYGRLTPPGRQRGFSMIEMMMSMAIGLVVTGAVLYTVSGSSASGRRQDVQATMHDSGHMVLTQLVEHLRMTGFWLPPSEVFAIDASENSQSPIWGCNQGFDDPTVAWDDLACKQNPQSNDSDALALRFQVQPFGRNWDCLGNEVTSHQMVREQQNAASKAGGNNNTYVPPPEHLVRDEIEERFFVQTEGENPGLYCQSVTSIEPQLMASNIDQLRIRYGVSPVNAEVAGTNSAFDLPLLSGRSARYLRASELSGRECLPGATADNSWCAVNAVQLCLVMRSDDNVNDKVGTSYVDCDGQVRTVNDRRLRQAFTMTVAIRNKVAP